MGDDYLGNFNYLGNHFRWWSNSIITKKAIMKVSFNKYWWSEIRGLLFRAGTHWRGRTSGYFYVNIGPIDITHEVRKVK
jgi:hypothetical protein